ncbi:hypothetical protein Nmar_1137 [Nitrosopumilus maritimus SCM1]|uniref:Uncharacterized protein n=2 Tax=Nitrosopumilus maritimus TaxID=338192 RepID=A9A4Q5_NITMS|nr:hypothetical protein Nmar_1137 [Nitrosopumilus maritimus SCM1]
MKAYNIMIVFGITVIVIIGGVMGFPIAKMFVGIPDYDIRVDAVIDEQEITPIGQVLIQNTGSKPLTEVKIDFGEGEKMELGTLDVRDRMILTPPYNNKMESVTVSADHHISVNKEYRNENLQH